MAEQGYQSSPASDVVEGDVDVVPAALVGLADVTVEAGGNVLKHAMTLPSLLVIPPAVFGAHATATAVADDCAAASWQAERALAALADAYVADGDRVYGAAVVFRDMDARAAEGFGDVQRGLS